MYFGKKIYVSSFWRVYYIYIYIVMSVIEGISIMSKSGCDDKELLDYIYENYDEIECELNGDEYKEPKHDRSVCIDCNMEMTTDYQKSTLVCKKCGFFEYYPVYVASYNHTMQPLRRKCLYKRSDNFKVILNQFFYGGKKLVPDNVMDTIRDEIHDVTNILYNFDIPLTIPILECILKRNELMTYKGSTYHIYFKFCGKSFPHITTKEYNLILSVFDVVSSIYDKYKPKGRKSFLNCHFVLKKLMIMLEKVEYAKCIPPLKIRSKQNEFEQVWDPEFVVAL